MQKKRLILENTYLHVSISFHGDSFDRVTIKEFELRISHLKNETPYLYTSPLEQIRTAKDPYININIHVLNHLGRRLPYS